MFRALVVNLFRVDISVVRIFNKISIFLIRLFFCEAKLVWLKRIFAGFFLENEKYGNFYSNYFIVWSHQWHFPKLNANVNEQQSVDSLKYCVLNALYSTECLVYCMELGNSFNLCFSGGKGNVLELFCCWHFYLSLNVMLGPS